MVEGEANALGAAADDETGRLAVPTADGDAGMLD